MTVSSDIFLDMEDNDEDGDEDGFEDALEAGEREAKEDKDDLSISMESVALVADGNIAVGAQLSSYNSEETEVKSEVEIETKAEGQGEREEEGEDDLVSAMQSTSISGSHISEMPTP